MRSIRSVKLLFPLLLAGLIFAGLQPLHASDITSSGLPQGTNLFVSAINQSPIEITLSATPYAVTLDVDIQGVETELSGGTTHWHIPNEGLIQRFGKPELPAIGRWVKLPEMGKIKLSYSADYSYEYADSPPPVYNGFNADMPEMSLQDEAVYPPEAVTISKPMIMRGVRMALVNIYPVRWDEQNQTYIRTQNVHIEIEASAERGINEIRNIQRHKSHDFDNLLQALLTNPPRRDDQNSSYLPGGYLVVIPDYGEELDEEIRNVVDEFISWKRRAGHAVDLLTFDPQDMLPAELKQLIRDRYEDTGFEFLVFMGSDDAEAPIMIPFENDYYAIYYGQLEGDDMLPDVAVGVFNCLTVPSLLGAVKRSVSYQFQPYMEDTDWYNRGGVAVGACSVPNDLSPSYTGKWVAEVMRRNGFTELRTSYYADNRVDDPTQMVRGLYNDGTNFILVRAHQSSFDPEDIDESEIYPFQFLCSSSTIGGPNWGAFNFCYRMGTPDEMKGPSAGFGHFSSPRTNVANALAGGLTEALFFLDIPTFGWARNYTVANLARVMPDDGLNIMPYYYSHWRYYGDPGQKTWMGVPQIVHAEFAETIDPDATAYSVTVLDAQDEPVENALVTLTQPEFHQISVTDRRGEAVLLWSPDNGFDAGLPVVITVSGKNIFPYSEEVDAADWDQLITLSEVRYIDDLTGNGDGIPNAGESGSLRVEVINSGENAINREISLGFDSNSPYVIAEGRVRWNERVLQPNEALVFNQDFNLIVDPSCPDGEVINLILTCNIGNDFDNSGTTFTVEAPNIEISDMDVIGNPGPGQQIQLSLTLANTGDVDLPRMTALLQPTSMFSSVPSAVTVYPDIRVDEAAGPVGNPFVIEFSDQALDGMQDEFRLVLLDRWIVLDTIYFKLNIGAAGNGDIVGPDQYGYFAIDNTDNPNDWAETPRYVWIDINQWHGNIEGEPLIAVNEEDDFSVAIELPFTFRYYGQEFDTITVCSNGWIAVGNQSSLKNQQNWVMPGFDGAYGMIAAFWDRLQFNPVLEHGVFGYFDVDNRVYVLQWDAYVENENQDDFPNTFQILIFDPVRYPSATGDSEIMFQYRTVNNVQQENEANFNCTAGISSPDGLDGITYTFWNDYPAGAAPLAAGRAILWTTIRKPEPGIAWTQLQRTRDDEFIVAAQVTGSNGYTSITNHNGHFEIVNFVPGEIEITASAPGYGSVTQRVNIAENEVINLDLNLPWALFEVEQDTIELEWEEDDAEVIFGLHNLGDFVGEANNFRIVFNNEANPGAFNYIFDPQEVEQPDNSEMNISLTALYDNVGETYEGIYDGNLMFDTNTLQGTISVPLVFKVKASGISSNSELPHEFSLSQPYPNPFNPTTTLKYAVPTVSDVSINLYDLQGRIVQNLVSGIFSAGYYTTAVQGKDLPAGLYLVKMTAGEYQSVQRVILMK